MVLNRFIPVGTGNTWKVRSVSSPIAVHPRGHGEHTSGLNTSRPSCGSSPWARGTHQEIIKLFGEIRFIPVGTGNTYALSRRTLCIAVHPRGHGEHTRPLHSKFKHGGSSPWARGTLVQYEREKVARRFIPVGTGNTASLFYARWQIAVHPRGHGEHQAPQRMPVAAIGSSPWARGTQTLGKYCLVFRRFIPVGTGNTAPP